MNFESLPGYQKDACNCCLFFSSPFGCIQGRGDILGAKNDWEGIGFEKDDWVGLVFGPLKKYSQQDIQSSFLIHQKCGCLFLVRMNEFGVSFSNNGPLVSSQ